MLTVLEDGLKSHDLTVGQHMLVQYGRVKLAEHIGAVLQPNLIILLIGERPGGDALSSRSMSAYLVYKLNDPDVQQKAAVYSQSTSISYEYTLITNIYTGGLPPVEAGSVVVEKAIQILTHRAAGNRLEDLLKGQL
jgi:ethanolamine ammonia-lyase large subunit